jgi:transposase
VHPFYEKLNELLRGEHFDAFVEDLCAKFYAQKLGRPSLLPGIYFRALLIGYFEGIEAERGIAWRLADSLALRSFVGIRLTESTPDHSTLSRTRRLIDLETHSQVFAWVLELLAARGLIKGKSIGIDATTLEANAAMRSIVRRDTGESYEQFLTGLAKASGIETPTREDLVRLDRKRKKRTSNKEWTSPIDADARVAKMKDGSTHLAHKAEHAVDMDTGQWSPSPCRPPIWATQPRCRRRSPRPAWRSRIWLRTKPKHAPTKRRRSTWMGSKSWSPTRDITALRLFCGFRSARSAVTFPRKSRQASATGKTRKKSARRSAQTRIGCRASTAKG